MKNKAMHVTDIISNDQFFISHQNHVNYKKSKQVEKMIEEMVRTYLPDYTDKNKFSPHKLRATCATRILTQTGDIQLAATQMNHKGISVTAAYYAELQKEKQKEKIRQLDMSTW